MDFGLKTEVKTEPEFTLESDDIQFAEWNMKSEEVDVSDLEFPDESDSESKTWPPQLVQDDIVSDSKSNYLGENSLKMHTSSHKVEENELTLSDSDPRQCQICKMCFISKVGLAYHKSVMHESSKKFKCTVCHKRFQQKRGLGTHIKSHFDVQARQCQVCNKWCANEKGMFIHMAIHKRENSLKMRTASQHVEENELTLSDSNPHRCQICKMCFISKVSLAYHMSIMHESANKFKCTVKSQYHIKSHFDVQARQCHVCGKWCVNKRGMLIHMAVHKRENFLKMHTSIHKVEENELTFSESNPHQCQICKMCFISNVGLAYHKSIRHESPIKFNCTVCNKRFQQKRGLGTHIKSHFDAQARQCQVCGKWCANENGLLIHMAIHKRDKPFQCSMCRKGFMKRRHLKTHIALHENLEPFKCDFCERTFKKVGYLARHMSYSH